MVQVGGEQTLKLEEWLFVKADMVNVFDGDVLALQAKINSVDGEGDIVLFPRKPLFSGGCHDSSIFEKRCRCVVVITADAEDVHVRTAYSGPLTALF